jgi:hypothetical protein
MIALTLTSRFQAICSQPLWCKYVLSSIRIYQFLDGLWASPKPAFVSTLICERVWYTLLPRVVAFLHRDAMMVIVMPPLGPGRRPAGCLGVVTNYNTATQTLRVGINDSGWGGYSGKWMHGLRRVHDVDINPSYPTGKLRHHCHKYEWDYL